MNEPTPRFPTRTARPAPRIGPALRGRGVLRALLAPAAAIALGGGLALAQGAPPARPTPEARGARGPDLTKLPADSLARLDPEALADRVDQSLWCAEHADLGDIALRFRPPRSEKDLPSHENVALRFLWTPPSEALPFPANSSLRVEGLPDVWRFRADLMASDFSFAVYPFLNRPLRALLEDYHAKVLPNPQNPRAAQILLTPLAPETNPLLRRRLWIDENAIPRREEATSRLAARTLTEFEYHDLPDGRHLLVKATTRNAAQPQAAPAVFEYLYADEDSHPRPRGVRVTLGMKESSEILYEPLHLDSSVAEALAALRAEEADSSPSQEPR